VNDVIIFNNCVTSNAVILLTFAFNKLRFHDLLTPLITWWKSGINSRSNWLGTTILQTRSVPDSYWGKTFFPGQ